MLFERERGVINFRQKINKFGKKLWESNMFCCGHPEKFDFQVKHRCTFTYYKFF